MSFRFPTGRSFVRLALLTALSWAAAAQVAIHSEPDGIFSVAFESKPFAVFCASEQAPKPYFSEIRSAAGNVVTRRFPMVKGSGESTDHPHHRGLWFGYESVNGYNFWENESAYHNPKAGVVKPRSITIEGTGLHGVFDWLGGSDREKVLVEDRRMQFTGGAGIRTIDFGITLTASEPAVFVDQKDGAFAIRVADPLTETKGTGVLMNSTGARTSKVIWGKTADWVDYSGTLNGEAVGIVMMEHPSSFHHPSHWHARDYGLLAVNPFAAHAYDPAAQPITTKLAAGEKIHLRYRVTVHGPMTHDELAAMYRDWAAKP